MSLFNKYIIDSQVVLDNVKAIKKHCAGKKICAVVKADAYGLGVESICKIIKNKVDYYAVNSFSEAMKIRKYDKKTKVIILGKTMPCDYECCAKNNFEVTIDSEKDLPKIGLIKPINIHIAINSGMNRIGISSMKIFKRILAKTIKSKSYNVAGIYTHFAGSAEKFNREKLQFERLDYYKNAKFSKKLLKNAENEIVFHAASSSTISKSPEFLLDMVRVGFALYGGGVITKPVLTIKAKIIKILKVNIGERIGYEPAFVASKPMTVGVVSMGYADGFSRRLSNNFSVLVNGEFARVIGLVCMDMFFVDLTNVRASFLDDVTILGSDGDKKLTLEDYARALNTSPYEILTSFNRKRMECVILK